MTDAELIARYRAASAKPDATGALFSKAYIAIAALDCAIRSLALNERALAKAQQKAEIATAWAEHLPEDAAEAAAEVAAIEQDIARLRDWRAESRAKADAAMATLPSWA